METAALAQQWADEALVAAEQQDECAVDHGALMRWITMMARRHGVIRVETERGTQAARSRAASAAKHAGNSVAAAVPGRV